MFICAHVYDVALCRNTVKMLLFVSDWLTIPDIYVHEAWVMTESVLPQAHEVVVRFFAKTLRCDVLRQNAQV